VACGGYVLETSGTPLQGKRVPAERLVRVVAALAEGLGIRAVAWVFEVAPNTPTVSPLFTSVASRNLLLYQSLPTSIQHLHAILRRRKDDTCMGTAARGIVE
jgi:hypothetical protein